MNLMKTDWDLIEKVIEEMLNDHMRTWGWYDYFIVDDETILVKVYNEDDDVMFTVKAKAKDGKLEVVDVW
ncbi:hypothetical protein [Sulfolobus acidocaldarius]|uniref:hypothetical protein n=1 Tax=Sulfolobus acidocaldarius TaxID=2285 RepID=UPI000782CEF7|nr:hypothetical protein [Sulfolobus acidocaldarius]